MPADVRAVIELFATQLAKVSFPDLDAASLRREADELRAEARLVESAREALEVALAAAEVRRATLVKSAARAVAYAQIYSDAHPDRQPLAKALATVSEVAAPPVAPAKRRGRPPRHGAELFDATRLPAMPSQQDPA